MKEVVFVENGKSEPPTEVILSGMFGFIEWKVLEYSIDLYNFCIEIFRLIHADLL